MLSVMKFRIELKMNGEKKNKKRVRKNIQTKNNEHRVL